MIFIQLLNYQIQDLRILKNVGEFQLISDNACAKYLFLGKAISSHINDIDFENINVTISTNKS